MSSFVRYFQLGSIYQALWETTWTNYMLMIASIPEPDNEGAPTGSKGSGVKEMDIADWC